MTPEAYAHRFEPGPSRGGAAALLLHGTGGDEHDLLAVGARLFPGLARLSPRGRVLEQGAARFFRRRAEGVFDLDDLFARTDEIAEWLRACATHYGFDPSRVVALGYSNGANLAASLLFRRPSALAAAALLRPMLPYEPSLAGPLNGRRVLVAPGARDPLSPPGNPEHLADLLRAAGAEVTLRVSPAGHELAPSDLTAVADWYGAAPLD